MKSTLTIATLWPVIGMAAMASAQAPVSRYTTNFGVLEVRWAVDGDGRNAEAFNPIDASLVNLTPGTQSTAVGLTLQARIAITAVNTSISTNAPNQGNYGIGRVSFASSNSYNRIRHNDVVTNSYTGGLSRGQTTVGDVGTGSISSLPTDGYALFGAVSQFRAFVGGYGSSRVNVNNWNAANGNAVANQNVRPGNVQTTGGGITSNARLNNGIRSRLANGFQEQAGQNGQSGTTLAAFDASVETVFLGEVVSSFTNLGNTGTFSDWANLYRAVFHPNPVGAAGVRDVTVTMNGRFQYIASAGYHPDVDLTIAAVYDFLPGLQESVAVATFTVPTPAAAALLGLGGLMAARRRRGWGPSLTIAPKRKLTFEVTRLLTATRKDH